MEKTDNRTVGGRFEQEIAKALYDAGFWVHVLQQNVAGQPADIIAIKGSYHALIDCKVVSTMVGFPFKRVEENQYYAMTQFEKKAGHLCWFFFRLPDGDIRCSSLGHIKVFMADGKTKFSMDDLKELLTLEEWLSQS